MHEESRELVREAYANLAQQDEGCCGSGSCPSCGGEAGSDSASGSKQASAAATASLSCGNPLEFAGLQAGEIVLDLGSGSGREVIGAAAMVGSRGRAYGVDFSAEMLKLARDNAHSFMEMNGLNNIEFREGDIDDLPFFNASMDVVISNCVINLCSDQRQVFSEAFRVLRPGGRIVISDLVVEDDPARQALAERSDASAAYASALPCQQYIDGLAAAGFTDIQVLKLQRYGPAQSAGDPVTGPIQDLLLRLAASLTVSAVRPG